MMNQKHTNDSRWQTPIGQDCINLDCSLAKWLGERLLFLSQEPKGAPEHWRVDLAGFEERVKVWAEALNTHGQALLKYELHASDWPDLFQANDSAIERGRVLELGSSKQNQRREKAQEAIRFVADNFGSLWD